MFITLINDCKSENDIGRLKTRYSLLFPNTNINFVGIDSSLGSNATLEASGNLIDILDASEGKEGIIGLNVAPRGQVQKDGDNGSSFCYFYYKNTLIVSTIKGYNLSLVKKLKLVSCVNLLDTKEVLGFAVSKKLINAKLVNYIVNSQFRSFDFQTRLAKWIWDGLKIPSSNFGLKNIPASPDAIWLIDSFGNAKTSLLPNEVKVKFGEKLKTNVGTFKFYERLKDLAIGETAFYVGSSGLGNRRFVEIALQGINGSASKKLKLDIGIKIKLL